MTGGMGDKGEFEKYDGQSKINQGSRYLRYTYDIGVS